ncbi:hypothetical protein M758_4G025300 [Ceratodon purpureus]|nr:hypothetical protein M758_4G025300 [Ceratodon purpureus]
MSPTPCHLLSWFLIPGISLQVCLFSSCPGMFRGNFLPIFLFVCVGGQRVRQCVVSYPMHVCELRSIHLCVWWCNFVVLKLGRRLPSHCVETSVFAILLRAGLESWCRSFVC